MVQRSAVEMVQGICCVIDVEMYKEEECNETLTLGCNWGGNRYPLCNGGRQPGCDRGSRVIERDSLASPEINRLLTSQ